MNALVRRRSLGILAVSVALAGCGGGDATSPTESASPFPDSREVNEAPPPLDAGTYFVDADGLGPDFGMRVHLTLPADGWAPPISDWRGVAKSTAGEDRDVALTITTVENVAQDGCADAPADPPVGPSIDDLATALAELSPFEVREAPSDVSAYGYEGKHLVLAVPDDFDMSQCLDGNLFSWIEAKRGDDSGPFFGYGVAGAEEEIWILDVEGTRLMIAVMTRPGAAAEDQQEMEDILDSIRIEP